MHTLLVWTGGFAGLAAFIVCTVTAIVAAAAHAWDRVALLAVLALASLGGAILANQRIERDRRERNAQRLQAAAGWTGHEITARLRWGRWFFGTGMAVAVAAIGILLAQSSKPQLVLAGALLAAVCVVGAGGLLRLAFAAAAAGHVLRLDPLGIHHCRTETIAWRDVLAIDLKKVTVKGRTSHFLVLALKPQALAERKGGVLRWIDWMRPRVVGNNLEIPLALAAGDPDVIAQAARVIGGRAGVPLASGWFHGTDVSLAIQRSQAMQDWSAAMTRSTEEAQALLQRVRHGGLRPGEMDEVRERMKQADTNAGQAHDRLRELNTTFLQEQRRRIAAATRVVYAILAIGYSVWTRVQP